MIAAIPLTVNAIYSQRPAAGIPPTGFTWSPDGRRLIYFIPSPDENGAPAIHVRDVRTGEDRTILHARSQRRGSRSRAIAQIAWSPRSDAIAYLDGDAVWVAGGDGRHPRLVASEADDPQWSPDGTRIAFVRHNDIYFASLAPYRVTRVTFSGTAARINGDPDWLYSEELDVDHAFAWSPAGDAIAYLSFDESPVAPFPIQNYLPTANTVELQRYPLAGARNPRVSLHVVNVRTLRDGTLYDGAPRDEYLVSFVWAPDGRSVVQEILDRDQQHLRFVSFTRNGAPRTLWKESSRAFVDVQPAPVFLPDGSRFALLSAAEGVQAIYLVDCRSGRVQRISGATPVAAILKASSSGIYASVLAPTRRDLALAFVPLSAGTTRIVSPGAGWHAVAMAVRGDAYVDSFSSFQQPPSVVIRNASLPLVQTLFATPSLARYDLGTTRALEIPSQWGPLDAELTVPHGFDPSRRYPVIVYAYGGPLPLGDSLPSSNRWQGLYAFLLAERGFLVFSVDGPASNPGGGRLFRYAMGRIAMAGQLAGVRWLREQPYVEGSRLGLYGWSYGGYVTAFTLTHAPGAFRSGIAGAPPADWRFYDSAYTERYMGMPQQQALAYRSTSVLPQASRLVAHLLIMQGSSDDNVHLMNSIALLRAFIASEKQVDYFLFPGARHGVTGIPGLRTLYAKMLSWWERTLSR